MFYMSFSQPKDIKFGWDFTKLYQFNIKQMEMCSFLGPPCILAAFYIDHADVQRSRALWRRLPSLKPFVRITAYFSS